MECRLGCGACCIAPSITSSIPGMPNGKPAGTRCIQLDENNKCMLFEKEGRPSVCSSLKPNKEMCGKCKDEAIKYLNVLEDMTKP
ncbi:MAG: YkgJ family cysteine cluster protein [Cellulosilyticaceae bacterium]